MNKEVPLDIEAENKRNLKIAKTLIRLKHSLAADAEIEDYGDQSKAALLKGGAARADITLKELLGK